MESSRLFRLALRQGGEESLRALEPYGIGRARHENRDRGISVTVVETIEDLEKVFALRTAVSLSGAARDSPETDIDDSDFGSVHLLAWIGQEVWGSLRIRIAEGAAFLDRLVIKRHRYRPWLVGQLIESASALCRAKGVAMITASSGLDSGALLPETGFQVPAVESGAPWDEPTKRKAVRPSISGQRYTTS